MAPATKPMARRSAYAQSAASEDTAEVQEGYWPRPRSSAEAGRRSYRRPHSLPNIDSPPAERAGAKRPGGEGSALSDEMGAETDPGTAGTDASEGEGGTEMGPDADAGSARRSDGNLSEQSAGDAAAEKAAEDAEESASAVPRPRAVPRSLPVTTAANRQRGASPSSSPQIRPRALDWAEQAPTSAAALPAASSTETLPSMPADAATACPLHPFQGGTAGQVLNLAVSLAKTE